MSKETALPKNIRQIGEIQGDEKICLEDYVMTCIHKKEAQEKDGYLGIFFGEQQKAEDGTYVFIRGILELPGADDQEQMAEELKKRQTEYFPGWEVQGCCVIGQYPTERMAQMEDAIPGATQFIYHLQEQEETLYRMKNGRYQKIKGYIVFYEQNRKMQEYLEEEFKEDRVEKESLPDKAIKSFREKVRSKSEKRRGSMLKLASSFFVVTVLAAGAVAVTRMDDIRRLQNVSESGGITAESGVETEEQDHIYSSDQAEAVSAAASGVQAENGIAAGETAQIEKGIAAGETSQAENRIAADEAAQIEKGIAAGEVSQAEKGIAAGETSQAENGIAAGEALQAENGIAAGAAVQVQNKAAAEDVSSQQNGGATEEASQAQDRMSEADYVEGSFAASAAARGIHATYTIRTGDTLADICNQYYGNLNKLEAVCEANEITDPDRIMPGQKIVLP